LKKGKDLEKESRTSEVGLDNGVCHLRFGKKPGASAQACNPSYSEGRDLEARGLRPNQAKKLTRLHLKKQAERGGACL
jgi:hypothetical protein